MMSVSRAQLSVLKASVFAAELPDRIDLPIGRL